MVIFNRRINQIQMKYIIKILILCFINIGYPNSLQTINNQFLFCLKSDIEPLNINIKNSNISTGLQPLDNWIKKNNIKNIEQWLPIAHPNDNSGGIYLNRIYRLILFENHLNSINKLRTDLEKFSFIHSTEIEHIRAPLYTPNDPQYNNQWFLPQVNATQAWDFWNIPGGELPGNPNVILASVDTGVDWDHNDLVGSLWQNLGEDADGDGHTIEYINGQWVLDPGDLNEIDDDNSDGDPATLIDDLIGWDCSGWSGEQDNDPKPGNGGGWSHGTHVAGLLNATTDNNTGIASVSFNSKIMSVKVSRESQQGQIYITEGYLGILYAAQAGYTAGSFSIINNSWGGIGYSTYEQEVINVCHNTYNAIVLAAAGNGDGGELYGTHYPSSYDNVISVTALGTNDSWNHWANYHESVDISSPGESIRSTVTNNNYSSWAGTSMATPIVASCAGLLQAFRPDWTSEHIGTMIVATADPIIYSINSENYLNGKLGTGRVDVLQALSTELYPKLELVGYDYEITNNSDGTLSPGDELHLFLVLFNLENWGEATNVDAQITTSSNYVNLLNDNASFPNIEPGEAMLNESGPFIIGLNNNFNQDSLLLTININSNEYNGRYYQKDFYISFPVFYDSSFGDLNNDNNINVLDVMILINLILDNIDPLESGLIIADLNNDNVFDILDIIILVNLIIE
tara:strand:+ start:2605 stop:4659 length:2055 start_codon:yes stop_codon:yes gene_type:complete